MRYFSKKKNKKGEHPCSPSLWGVVSDDGLEPPTYAV
jgi:hypothetical protein